MDGRNIPGQMDLFEFLEGNYARMPPEPVEVTGIINIKSFSDFRVQSTYRDIFLIINMLDDYVEALSQKGAGDSLTGYMVSQFERISRELSEQICLDKEKMYKRCKKRQGQKDDVGEDAMVLAFGKHKKEGREMGKRNETKSMLNARKE